MKTIKCDSCGANLNTDTDNVIQFCPFCGNAIKMPENCIDLAKFVIKHEESVRKQKVIEEKARDKQLAKIFAAIFGVAIIICAMYFILRGNNDSQLKKKVSEVQQMIIDENYDDALVAAQSIRVEKEGLFDSRYAYWENQRKDLMKLIEQKKKESGK